MVMEIRLRGQTWDLVDGNEGNDGMSVAFLCHTIFGAQTVSMVYVFLP